MKKVFLPFFILMLFSAVLIVDSVKADTAEENMIYIRSDGYVEPSTAPIQCVENVYTFTDDIYGSIIVEKDNVVIDGTGFTLQGTGSSDYRPAIPEFNITQMFNRTIEKRDETILPQSNNTGIYSYAQKLTIMNLTITEFWCAIELEYSSDNCIIDNEIINNTQGIWIHTSSNNTISGNNIKNNTQGITLTAAHNNIHLNNITNNSEYGIKLFWSFNTLSGNRVENNRYGVNLEQSTHNVFRNNSFSENTHVFYAASSSFQEYIQDVDISNLANGKPIYYWIDKEDLTVPTDAGWVTLVNCTRIKIENLNLAFGQQILLISTTNSTVTKNVMTHNHVCIYFRESSNNTISENTITNSVYGIQLLGSSNNYIVYNDVMDNTNGIDLASSQKNIIQQNLITRNTQGIKLVKSTGNIISGNNLTANVKGIYLGRRLVIMDMNDPYNSTIVYGCSNNTVSKNNISENNCGVWMSSASNNTFSGNNFISNTDQIKMEDSTSFLVASGIEPTGSRFASINFWDDDKEGNYWSDYENRYPNATERDDSGTWGTPYVLDEDNQDNYPLMNPHVISEVPDDKKPATSDLTLITIAVIIVLAILFGVAFYRRKKIGKQQTPIQ